MPLDLLGMKAQRKEQEEKFDTPNLEDNALAKSYADTWGPKFGKIEFIEVQKFIPFVDDENSEQPFELNEEKVLQLMESIKEKGVLTPVVARKLGPYEYQIIAGHHRLEACRRLNILSIPTIVKEYDDNSAYEVMVETNIQRDSILPSEYGKIFTKYLQIREAMATEMTVTELCKKFGIGKSSFYIYCNVNKLVDYLKNCIDSGRIYLHCADSLWQISLDEQVAVCDYMRIHETYIMKDKDAKKIKKFSLDRKANDEPEFTYDDLEELFAPKQKEEKEKPKKLTFFDEVREKHTEIQDNSDDEVKDLLFMLLDEYMKK